MPDIRLTDHPFDLVFHPTHPILFTGLLTGHVQAYTYDDHGNSKKLWSIQSFKKSCRCLDITVDGRKIWAGGKGKAIASIDVNSGEVYDKRLGAHEGSINRIKALTEHLLSTGDDNGVVKLWDPRLKEPIRTYTHHFDYITDFLWLDDKKQLVATSGDGTLSVVDVRSKKTKPYAHSEDQEDELLSIVAMQGATKFVVGTQLGILSIFDRSKGWGDCVDRVPGHPQSVDALLSLPSDFPGVKGTTILTGSSDGYVRAVEILPTKLLGVVADHGKFPVERIALGRGGGQQVDDIGASPSTFVTRKGKERRDSDGNLDALGERWWLGSVGHDELLRLTDLRHFFANCEGNTGRVERPVETSAFMGDDDEKGTGADGAAAPVSTDEAEGHLVSTISANSSDEEPSMPKTRKRRQKDPLIVKKKIGRNQLNVDGSFFAEL